VVGILQLHYQKNGDVYSFGNYKDGRLGLGDINDNINKPTLIKSLSNKNIIKIHCGASHTFAISNNGDVYGFGYNLYGQLGNGNNDDILEPILLNWKYKKNIIINCTSWNSFLCN